MKLFRTLSFVISSLILLAVAIGQESGQLPSDSDELIRKLKEYESAELEKAHERIREKRMQVVQVLETHLKRETQSGNFESAIAVKKEIEGLTPDETKEDVKAETGGGEDGMMDFREWAESKVFVRGDGLRYSINGSKMVIDRSAVGAGAMSPEVTIAENRLSWKQMENGNPVDLHITVNKERTRATGVDAKGVEWSFKIEVAPAQ